MSFEYGNKLKIKIFGASHSEEIGVLIDGIPEGFEIDKEELQKFLDRRKPGKDNLSTGRKESDIPDFSYEGKTLKAVIKNTDRKSKDYDNLKFCPRPGHADYPAMVKFGDKYDYRGGGIFSARMTAPLCVAGGICLQILKSKGICIGAHLSSVYDINDDSFNRTDIRKDDLLQISSKNFPVINDEKGELMMYVIEEAKKDGDSVGGTVECAVTGLPVGLGDHMFDGLENKIASVVFGIPAVKGLEFGDGFGCSKLKGSENNDEYYYDNGRVYTKTNHNGGVLGGMSSGMPLIFRVAFKPTPSISKEQNTVNMKTHENVKLIIKGRHDPCVAVRAVPITEAAAAIAICNIIL